MRLEQTLQSVLINLKENASTLQGVRVGVFGSVSYANVRDTSDIDLMVVLDSDHDEVGEKSFFRKLLGSPFYSPFTSINHVSSEDAGEFAEDKIQILQVESLIDVAPWTENTLPTVLPFDFYIAKRGVLEQICALEPGGEVIQKYSSAPQRKAIAPYYFMTTAGKKIVYEQQIELLHEDGSFAVLGNGQNGTVKASDAGSLFNSYRKHSPGLPRVRNSDDPSVEGRIFIGTTGDKVLSMSMLHDPEGELAESLIFRSWCRVTEDLTKVQATFDHPAQLLQRYSSGRFGDSYLQRVRAIDQTARSGQFVKGLFTMDLGNHSLR